MTSNSETPAISEQEAAPVITTDPHILPDHRVASLDGVRGIALLLVVLHHLGQTVPFRFRGTPPWWSHISDWFFEWGWAGVDLFFVLSGYLITGILLDSKGTPNYFRNFYARRVLRIFPAYYLLLLIFLLILPAVAGNYVTTLKWGQPLQRWPYWLFISNMPNFLGTKVYRAISHTWSLAVEEQFYLLWPALVVFLSRQWMIWLCVGVIIASFIIRTSVLAHGISQVNIQGFTPARLDTLAVGGLLATLFRTPAVRRRLRLICNILFIASLIGLIVGSFFGTIVPTRGTNLRVSIGYEQIALACMGLVGVAATSPQNAWSNRILSFGALTWVGRFSYGLYLFHYPILVMMYRPMGSIYSTQGILMRFVVYPAEVVVAALLSWYLLEQPMLRLKRFFPTMAPKLIETRQS